ncbi:MAG: hypothetical protein K1X36_14480 [Pyrinomonadaceae bacterium]|nr:hypothetical protein [Pyrinomonadaceae bacterium]
MKSLKIQTLITVLLVLMSSVPAAEAQSLPTTDPKPSARSSNASAIHADAGLRQACLSAAADLEATRRLAEALTAENAALAERLEAEKIASAELSRLAEVRRAEAEAVKLSYAAAERVIAAKDAEIAARDKLIDGLKKSRSSPWRRLGDILIGAAAVAVLK